MPWNECKPMDERLRFIARLLEGERMATLRIVERRQSVTLFPCLAERCLENQGRFKSPEKIM